MHFFIYTALFACSSTESSQTLFTNSSTETGLNDDFPRGSFEGKYLMAMFSCDDGIWCDVGITNHDIWVMYSDDGVDWNVPENYEPYHGSVPDVVRRGNTMYVYDGGQQSVRKYDFATDTWDEPIELERIGMESELSWSDFSVVLGSDGKLHMFFLASYVRGDPAECQEESQSEPCTQVFGSAIEVEGSDGTAFERQPGSRLELPLYYNERICDPDVFQSADGSWVMYIAQFEGTAAYTSPDLHGTYEPVESLGNPPYISRPMYGLGVGHYDRESDQYWTYVNYPEYDAINIQRATHSGLEQRLSSDDFEVVVGVDTVPELSTGQWAASPGFAVNVP